MAAATLQSAHSGHVWANPSCLPFLSVQHRQLCLILHDRTSLLPVCRSKVIGLQENPPKLQLKPVISNLQGGIVGIWLGFANNWHVEKRVNWT